MRDGKRLFTSVYVPKDTSRELSHPADPHALQCRVPTAWTITRPPSALPKNSRREQFIFVYQDVRGRYMSEGDFVNMTPHRAVKRGPQDTDESTDTYDTIDWLVKHVPNNNGKVGMWGISYPGFYTSAGIIDAHPALEGRLPAGAHRRLVRGRRFPSQRHALPAAHVPLLRRLRPSAPRAHAAAARRHARPPPSPSRMATASSSASARSPTSTRSTSRTTSPSGPR